MLKNIQNRNSKLSAEVNSLLEAAGKHEDALLNRKPANGGWSALQTMHHLILSEELGLQYVRKKLSFGGPLPDAGPAAAWAAFLLWFYLQVPIKFRAPAIVGNENLPEQSTLADTRKRWTAIRTNWTDFFDTMPENLGRKAVYRHPLVGRLSWRGMFLFYHLHLQRHRKQIERALA